MDVMSIRRRLLMQSVQTGPVDLFNGSDMRSDVRVYATGAGSPIQLVGSTASKVYAFACAVTGGKQYKIQYTVTNPIATSYRQCCISDANSNMVYYQNMTIPQNAGYSEVTITAHDSGYFWLTFDKNASDIHIYEV